MDRAEVEAAIAVSGMTKDMIDAIWSPKVNSDYVDKAIKAAKTK